MDFRFDDKNPWLTYQQQQRWHFISSYAYAVPIARIPFRWAASNRANIHFYILFREKPKINELYSICDALLHASSPSSNMNMKSIDARVIQMPQHNRHSRSIKQKCTCKDYECRNRVVNELLMRFWVVREQCWLQSRPYQTTNYPIPLMEY